MALYAKTIRILIWTTIITILAFMYFLSKQLLSPTDVMLTTINNVLICIITGCLIGLIQSITGYYSEKRISILAFYKSSVIFLNKFSQSLTQISYCHNSNASFRELCSVTDYFYEEVKTNYFRIKMSKKRRHIKACFDVFIKLNLFIKEIELCKLCLDRCIMFLGTEDKLLEEDDPKKKAMIEELDSDLTKQANIMYDLYYDTTYKSSVMENIRIIEHFLFNSTLPDVSTIENKFAPPLR